MQLRKIIPFALMYMLCAAVYAILERGVIGDNPFYPSTGEPYVFSENALKIILASSLLGAFVAFFEIFFWQNRLTHLSFGPKLILKTAFYISLMVIFLILLSFFLNMTFYQASFYDPQVVRRVMVFVSTIAFWSTILYISLLTGITLFISQISDHLGLPVFEGLLQGRYYKPRREERIFMFLDLKSSTQIAEELGHIRYFELLKKYYAQMSEAIILCRAEVYQYVGDEIILSWPLARGLKEANCLRCFFEIKDSFQDNEAEFRKEFGLMPQFKAGVHFGEVTTGEIGELKREVVFSGDVLNTTARIQSLCNQLEAKLLISAALLD
ncbi:MAG: adenylate/guanylate cyclase domain-containing protein, partial [Bacteroidota bacterium]